MAVNFQNESNDKERILNDCRITNRAIALVLHFRHSFQNRAIA